MNYSLKTKIIVILAFLAMVTGLGVVLAFNSSRTHDIQLVSEAKVLATALEKYYDKFQSYPKVQKIAISQIAVISDQGVNQDGDTTYWRRASDSADSATLVSDGTNYVIAFEVQNRWTAWGIESFRGGSCRLVTNVVLQCK